MKNLKYALALTLAAAAVVSCQENALDNVEIQAPAESITLTATVPTSSATRIIESVKDDKLELSWFGGDNYNQPDRITVYNKTTGAKVGDFVINERDGGKETATFSAIGAGNPLSYTETFKEYNGGPDKDKVSSAVYPEADFTLEADVDYVAVFPASSQTTFDARNAEAISVDQYQAQTGGWRYAARMVSNEFTTANTNLSFTHESAFMSVDFIVPDGKKAKSFSCSDGTNTTNVNINGYGAAQEKYTAKFTMYPTTADQLTFTITADDDTKTTVVRNLAADILAGYCYKDLNLIKTVGTGNIILNGNCSSGAGAWDAPGINAYSGGYNFSFVENAGKDGSRCIKAAIKTPWAAYTKILFKEMNSRIVENKTYNFTADMKSSVSCDIAVKFQDGSNNQKCDIALTDKSLVADEWKTVTGTVTIPTGSNLSAMIIPLDPVGAGGVFMLDNISLSFDTKTMSMPSDE